MSAALVAAPSIRNGFASDDLYVVEHRATLAQPSSLGALLREPWWPKTFGGRLWRPAVLASYALDYRVSASAHWFHFVNVVWTGLAVAALALLACALAGPTVGLVAGLLFAVHPVHVEATAGVVGRAELMAAAGYAVALLCALKPGRWWLLGVAAGSALAIGSKESGATLPVMMLLLLSWRGRDLREAAVPTVVSALPIALYFVLRASLTRGAFDPGGLAAGLEGLSMPQRATAMLGVSLQWWRLLFTPISLSADYSPGDIAVTTSLTWRHWLAALLWVAGGLLALRYRSKAPIVALSFVWVVITLAPVANVLVPTEILVAERTLFLPSFGAMLVVALIAMSVKAQPKYRYLLLAAAILGGAVQSAVREDVWRDPDHWYEALKLDAPESYRTIWLRGKEQFREQRWGSGERFLRWAAKEAPGIPGPREDLAAFYAQAGLWPQAEIELKRAMPLNWKRSKPWLQLAGVMLQRGDTARADAWIHHAALRFPGDADVQRADSLRRTLSGSPPGRPLHPRGH